MNAVQPIPMSEDRLLHIKKLSYSENSVGLDSRDSAIRESRVPAGTSRS
ncbi:hypothetical protein EVA_11608 [gut metagenome]|uniref:Uncharacterized protein n=1 Tax=gut metagenome TaxID=749906 RepID=J9GES6_9ZZZZ